MSIPRLHYFDVAGRAEATRLACYYGGMQFEDVRFSHDKLAEYKTISPSGQVPLLEINGKYYVESIAQLIYVGKKTGLLPEDPMRLLECMQIIMKSEDVVAIIVAARKQAIAEGKDPMSGIPAAIQAHADPVLEVIEKLVGMRTSDEADISDCVIFTGLSLCESMKPGCVAKYPKMAARARVVRNHPAVDKYLNEKRPDTVSFKP